MVDTFQRWHLSILLMSIYQIHLGFAPQHISDVCFADFVVTFTFELSSLNQVQQLELQEHMSRYVFQFYFSMLTHQHTSNVYQSLSLSLLSFLFATAGPAGAWTGHRCKEQQEQIRALHHQTLTKWIFLLQMTYLLFHIFRHWIS